MFSKRLRAGFLFLFLCLAVAALSSDNPTEKSSKFPYPEKLTYRIEWHLVTAGTAVFDLTQLKPSNWQISLDLESAGVVTKLYRVLDTYKAVSDAEFCASNSVLDAQEGKRHRVTRLKFDNTNDRVDYQEHDMLANTNASKILDVYPCTREIAGALTTLRIMDLQPGKSASIAITDGKKVAKARVDAQAKETITAEGKTYHTVRYEAFVFDNVIYKRKGRMFIWVTDDAERLPVQLRVQLGFPVGTINLGLVKQERE
jgi:hypothetical protein